METEHIYGERKCLICDTVFYPKRIWDITCKPECRTEWQRRRWRKNSKDVKARRKQRMEDLIKQLGDAQKHIEFLEGEIKRLQQKISTKDLMTCERMSLRATQLLCGQRHECFKPERCSQCPEDATIENAFDPATLVKHTGDI
ncbi:MAG: hypothetical protein IJA20_02760 [Methanocorpusculum sp.]|nr:hypothetical protein [Methanocorpusculum sp.]